MGIERELIKLNALAELSALAFVRIENPTTGRVNWGLWEIEGQKLKYCISEGSTMVHAAKEGVRRLRATTIRREEKNKKESCCSTPKTRGPNVEGKMVCPIHCSKCGHERIHEDYLGFCSACKVGEPCFRAV